MNQFLGFLGEHISTVLLIINLTLGLVLILFEHKNTSTMWAWLLVLYFLPIIGFILYLFFGRDLRGRKIFQTKQQQDMRQIAKMQQESIDQRLPDLKMDVDKTHLDTVRMLLNSASAVISTDNMLDLFVDGKDKFESLLYDLEHAKRSIWIQYYIFRSDELGKKVMDILVRKAKEGVDVRLLTDGVGSARVKPFFFSKLSKAGGHYEVFYRTWIPILNFRLNFRNHRKNVVIDNRIGYVGGYNVGDEYLGKGKLGYWRDTHLRLQGSAVRELAMRFFLDWNYASLSNKIPSDDFYQQISLEAPARLHALNTHPFPTFTNVTAQIVSSGPDSQYPNVRNGYLKLIEEAEQRIYIESPYLVLDEVMQESLKVAALSGIDVRIIIPKKPDHPMIDGANMSYVGELLEAGVKVYRYSNGFLHSKMIVVDDALCSVGTANMDIRSFQLDFEVNAFLYDKKVAQKIVEVFRTDLQKSEDFTLEDFKNRSVWMRIKMSLMKLISPLL